MQIAVRDEFTSSGAVQGEATKQRG